MNKERISNKAMLKLPLEEKFMSVEFLETIKEQTNRLSSQEKRILADYLVQSVERADQSDLSLPAESKEEKRRLRNEWMKSEANSEKYGGLYVALDGDKLIATGKNYPEAARKAKEAGVKDAVVDIVHPPGYVGEIGGWE